jgi:Cu2+-exporting ATPase
MIGNAGLEAYYRLRTTTPERPAGSTLSASYTVYDDLDACGEFASVGEDGTVTARLLVGGVTCAACTWLIEQVLGDLEGIRDARVNLANQQLTVRFAPAETGLGRVFQQLSRLGYRPHPFTERQQAQLAQDERREALARLAVAGLAMMQVGMFGIALHAGELQGISEAYRDLLRWVSLLVATVVVGYSARGFFATAWLRLRHGQLVMDLPVALAIGLAYLASAWATITGSGQVYFDSVAMFTFFLLLARYLESRARQRQLLLQTDLVSLLPETARRRQGESWQEIRLHELVVGDVVKLATGTVIPADGVLLSGDAAIDEAAFTGESRPRAVSPGDALAAGTVVQEGNPVMRVQALIRDTRLARLLGGVDAAADSKPAVSQLADRLAGWFIGAVLLLSAAVALAWWQVDPQRALWITLSVLVVSCPCALALATPAALTSASTWLRRRGLLVAGQNALQQLRLSDTVLLDKTGTLTRGDLQRRQTVLLGSLDEEGVVDIARTLEESASHPIARAFRDGNGTDDAEDVSITPGAGIEATVEGQRYRIGSGDWCRGFCPSLPPAPDPQGYWIALAGETEALAWFQLQDRLRDEAAAVVAELGSRGLHCALLTGDSSSEGPSVVNALGLAEGHFGHSPEQKVAVIRDLQSRGHRVTMIGDGLNDAAVLAAADCSIAVNEATDLAKSRADCILLAPDLGAITEAFKVADRCHRVIRQNLCWALAYNGLAVPLAAAGLVAPWLAAIGMSLSSLLVVSNSLRLNRHRRTALSA